MSAKETELLARQRRLVAKAAEQRGSVVSAFALWKKPISWLDKGLGALQGIQKNRVTLIWAFGLLASYKPSLARKIVGMGMVTLKLAHYVRNFIPSQKS